jgi:hypothetical protein
MAAPRVAGISHEDYARALAFVATASLAAVREIERRFEDPDYSPSAFELQVWVLLVRASEPDDPPEHVIIDEGDEWPPDPPSHAAWDAWYEQPIAYSIAAKWRLQVATGVAAARRHESRRRSSRRTKRSRRASSRSRARAPARSTDDDPDGLASCPIGRRS